MALTGFCKTLYHVAVKAGFYRKAVEVYFIPSPTTKLDFVPEVLGHRESFLMRLGKLLPGSRVGYLRWTPLSYVDVSESDDTVSEHEGLVSLSTIVSSGAGVVLFLGEEGSEKGLAMERQKHIPVQETPPELCRTIGRKNGYGIQRIRKTGCQKGSEIQKVL